MVHKRYIKKGGKIYGPYFYKSVRTKDGKVKNVYLGSEYDSKKNKNKPVRINAKKVVQKKSKDISIKNFKYGLSFVGIFLVLLLLVGFLGSGITGGVIKENYKPIFGDIFIEELKEQVINIGQRYEVNLKTHQIDSENLIFNENTNLFDISKEGKVIFEPRLEDKGVYNVAFILKEKGNEENYYFKIIRYVIR